MVQFNSLPKDKQVSIINAAFSCFGKNGYKKASISDIAAAAGISKASIFQYFGSKRELYMYLFEYACDKIIQEMPSGTDDFFECLRIGTEVKMRVMRQHPGMYDFLASLVIETDDTIVAEIKPYVDERINRAKGGLLGNVNWDVLKPEVDGNMLINTVRWINEGYLREYVSVKDAETIQRELYGYLDLIRNAYYKEEFVK